MNRKRLQNLANGKPDGRAYPQYMCNPIQLAKLKEDIGVPLTAEEQRVRNERMEKERHEVQQLLADKENKFLNLASKLDLQQLCCTKISRIQLLALMAHLKIQSKRLSCREARIKALRDFPKSIFGSWSTFWK